MPLPISLYLLAAAVILMAGGQELFAETALVLGVIFEVGAFFAGGLTGSSADEDPDGPR